MESIKMSNDLIKTIENIGGWDFLKKQEKLLIEQGIQDWQQHQANEEEGLLDELKF